MVNFIFVLENFGLVVLCVNIVKILLNSSGEILILLFVNIMWCYEDVFVGCLELFYFIFFFMDVEMEICGVLLLNFKLLFNRL